MSMFTLGFFDYFFIAFIAWYLGGGAASSCDPECKKKLESLEAKVDLLLGQSGHDSDQ